MIYEGDYFVGSALNGDSLSHHGIPKMRWGVKNGPPYPIQRGHDVHYALGKMTPVTRKTLEDAGKIAKKGTSAVGNAAKTVAKKVNSSFKNWKESKKEDLVTKETNSALMKNWQKKQLRISDMTNQELQQRTERKRLEEGYRRALRGDFSDPKTWKKGGSGDKGKNAADTVLRKFGDAAIDGLTKGLTIRVERAITAKSDRRKARKDAIANAVAEAKAKGAQDKAAYKAEQRNNDYKARKEAERERRNFQQSLIDQANFDRYAANFYGQRALPSGTNDMDELWNRYGPQI